MILNELREEFNDYLANNCNSYVQAMTLANQIPVLLVRVEALERAICNEWNNGGDLPCLVCVHLTDCTVGSEDMPECVNGDKFEFDEQWDAEAEE